MIDERKLPNIDYVEFVDRFVAGYFDVDDPNGPDYYWRITLCNEPTEWSLFRCTGKTNEEKIEYLKAKEENFYEITPLAEALSELNKTKTVVEGLTSKFKCVREYTKQYVELGR